jgi:glycosyltransferase involved in cell wall biosynthesis
MTACIYYHPEAYTTSGPKLMGRNAAGESFLRGFVSHSSTAEFWALVQSSEHAKQFARTVASAGRLEPVRIVEKNTLGALSRPGVVFYPGPGLGEHAFARTAFGHGAWSLCGITHTTSSAIAMDALAALLTAPVQPWDALICTSMAVKDNVARLLQAQADYLKSRLGITKMVIPQFPVIPLGIHTGDFVFSAEQRSAARSALGVSADAVVVLFMGRLSFHAKAHPLAMYQALESAKRTTGKEIVLVECGWHANEFIAKAFEDAARLACPSVRVMKLDGRKSSERQTAWAGADVFCSLSDNIQETFGIAPIEAMAAGLPVVVSDWDGYKDTVRDGVDGFRIPTSMPKVGLAGDLALRHALEVDTYDLYCGYTSSLVSVDIQATASAFERLFDSAELRHRMGDTARRRARETYDWKVVIRQYEALWARLSEIRRVQSSDLESLAYPWPTRADPFYGFASYPTGALTPQTQLALVDPDVETAANRLRSYQALAMVKFAQIVWPTQTELMLVLNAAVARTTDLVSGYKSGNELVQDIPEARRPHVFRSLSWLVKLGVLRIVTR